MSWGRRRVERKRRWSFEGWGRNKEDVPKSEGQFIRCYWGWVGRGGGGGLFLEGGWRLEKGQRVVRVVVVVKEEEVEEWKVIGRTTWMRWKGGLESEREGGRC